jgi:uncharacterized membrane protein
LIQQHILGVKLMSRVYFLINGLDNTGIIIDEFHKEQIDRKCIRVVGHDLKALAKINLIQASVLDTTALIPSLIRGTIIGLILGCICGLITLRSPLVGNLGYLSVIGLSFFGAAAGAWISSMIGISIPSEVIEKFQDSLQNGNFLLIVDLPDDKQEKLLARIQENHPDSLKPLK